jgi:hypothetical protein
MPGLEDLPAFFLVAAFLIWLVIFKRPQQLQQEAEEKRPAEPTGRRKVLQRLTKRRNGGKLPTKPAGDK